MDSLAVVEQSHRTDLRVNRTDLSIICVPSNAPITTVERDALNRFGRYAAGQAMAWRQSE